MTRLVALALPGGPAYVEAIQKVWAAGDAIAPIDLRLPKPELDHVMNILAPSAIIEADGEQRSLAGGEGLQPGDAVVIATSGTAGQPKAVIHTHESIRASAEATSSALSVDPSRDKWLACLPLAHIGGLAVVMRSLITDTPVEVHPRFDDRMVIAAADRGVAIDVLVPGQHADKRFVQIVGEARYAELLDAGITIRCYDRTMLHAKVLTVDGQVASVGSANLNQRSFQHDEEVNLVIFDPEVVAELDAHFEDDCRHASVVDPADWARRSLVQRAAERAVSVVSDLI